MRILSAKIISSHLQKTFYRTPSYKLDLSRFNYRSLNLDDSPYHVCLLQCILDRVEYIQDARQFLIPRVVTILRNRRLAENETGMSSRQVPSACEPVRAPLDRDSALAATRRIPPDISLEV